MNLQNKYIRVALNFFKLMSFNFLLILTLIIIWNPLCAQSGISRSLADSLYQQGNYSEAAKTYQQLKKQFTETGIHDSVAHYQFWEAKCLIQQYQYMKARKLLNRILSSTEPITDEHLISKIYHEIGYTYMGEGAIEEALKFSQKSIDLELAGNPVDTFQLAKYYEFYGFMELQSSRYEEAQKWVTRAHQLRKKILDPFDKELGYSANTLYIVLDAIGNLPAADTAISEAMKILNKNLPAEHPHLAILANNYGTHLLDMGNPQQAKVYLLQAIASNKAGERYFPLSANYVNLGMLYLNLNENKTAESYYQQAWEIADSLITYPHQQRANIKDALGAVYYQQDMIDAADSLFQLAYLEKLEIYNYESAEIGQSIYNLGLIARERQNVSRAGKYFKEAEQIRASVLGKDHPKRADVLYELGELAWVNESSQEAIRHWKSANKIYQQTYGLAHHHSLETLIRMAKAFSELQQPDSVHHYLQLAWSSACGLDKARIDILQASHLELKQFHPQVLELINFQLNELIRQQYQPENFTRAYLVLIAAQQWLPMFQSLYNHAALWETVSALIQDVLKKGAFLAHRALDNGENNAQWQDLLLYCIQASRGTTIRAAFKDREAIRFAGVPDSLTEKGNELQKQLQFVIARQQEDVDENARIQLALQQQKILQSWQEYQQMLQQKFPQYYQSRYQVSEVNLKDLQQTFVQQNHRLVAYFNLDTDLLGIVVSPESMKSNLLTASAGWQDSLFIYLKLLKNQQEMGRQARLGHYFYQLLWEPLNLPPQSTVKILADGPLYYLNFETLLTRHPDSSDRTTKWPWLIRDYCVYYGHDLQHQPDIHNRGKGKVLGIAPGFSPDLKRHYLNSLSNNQQPDSIFLGWLRTPWSISFVKKLQEDGFGKSLTESSATEHQFTTQAQDAEILHFATHARLVNERPLYSFLALTPDPGKNQDGYLHTYELYSQPLKSSLAILTACETGLGNYREGEGVLSLAHAFRYAGCPSVIYSLWSIDDQQSNEIIAQFYENLQQEMTFAQALRAAKLSMMEDANGIQSPYYWAGLVLTGEDQIIKLSSSENHTLIIIILVAIILSITLLLGRKRFFKSRQFFFSFDDDL